MVIVFIFIGKKKNSAESSRVNKLKRWLKKIKGLPARVKKKEDSKERNQKIGIKECEQKHSGKKLEN